MDTKNAHFLKLSDQKFENFHHGFMLGLFVQTSKNYIVESNKEYGLGRPDIVIIPKNTEKTAYFFLQNL